MKSSKITLCVVTITVCLLRSRYVLTGTAGTQFVVGFMENVESKYPPGLVIGGNINMSSNVTITCPGLNFSRLITVPKMDAVTVKLPHGAVANGTGHAQKGILIESTNVITVFGLNTASANSLDGFTAIPTGLLGQNYRVISSNVSDELEIGRRFSEFLLIGVFDNTSVKVRLTAPTTYQHVSYSPGDVIAILISRLETVQLQSLRDLTGTHVISSRPVAVLSGSKCANVPVDVSACDHLAEYLPPTDQWGREFILATFLARMSGDCFTLVGFEPGTIVTIVAPSVGSTTVNLKSDGDLHTFKLNSLESGYVTSSQPIMIAQFSQGAFADGGVIGDPSMLIVTPIDQWLQSKTPGVSFRTYDSTPDGSKTIRTFLTVTSWCSVIDDVVVDGKPLSVPTELVRKRNSGKKDDYLCVKRSQLTPGAHTIWALTTNTALATYVYGFGEHVSYAFPLGTGHGTPGPIMAPSPITNTTNNEETVYLSTDITRNVILSIAVTCVCVLIVFAFRKKLKAAVRPRPVSIKPRSIVT
ncbi:IgGFc-binding protein-like isoform X1 [Asterias rubens]|uniref:IgGFc-binding protein-like isoform X1 n=1 Tax=Asterias rubens TaxID=7604 RepID=UPI001454F90F|nr:IgGFc-binding protein-like isoform X1 [Asterias rubens]